MAMQRATVRQSNTTSMSRRIDMAQIRSQLRSPIWQRRELAAKQLADARDPTSTTLLVYTLAYDSSQRVRTAAQLSLVSIGAPAVQPLITALVSSLVLRDWQDEPHPDRAIALRQRLKDTLVLLGKDAHTPVQALLTHDDWAVQEEAQKILTQLQAHQK
jgi:hypothetical protein